MKKAPLFILLVSLTAGAFLAGSWFAQHKIARNGSSGEKKALYYIDPMHPAYKSDKPGIAPDCGMDLVPVYADGESGNPASTPDGVNISPEKQQLMGVRVSSVEKTSANHTLRLFGRVVPDETRIYRVNAGIDGSIREVTSATTGSQVKVDQLLATYVAPEFVSAGQSYIFALTAADRLKKNKPESASQIDPLTGDPINSNFQQRLERLENMGMSAAQIAEMGRTREIPKSIRIVAPADGFVLARNVSPGQKFDRGAELYRIADLRHVWILADVFGRDVQYLKPGTVARISLPDQGTTFRATVSDVLPEFDPAARSLKVRLEVDNPRFVLRPDMFVDVELPVKLPPAITAPVDAIVDSGLRKIVFLDRGNGSFEPREVETGWQMGDNVEIVKGLSAGERIVTSGTFLVDSESRLKAAAATYSVTKDPACGMEIDEKKARASGRTTEYQGKSYFFCSDQCKRDFEKSPEHYLHKPGEPEHKHLATGGTLVSAFSGARK